MFEGTPQNSEIDAFLASLRTPAILLHRPYPPVGLPNVRSRLGGLPCLPDGVEWPLGEEAVPLHFLAQIDCSELPKLDARLPESGMLFFFARDDEEQVWGYGDDPAADGRVIFVPNVPTNQIARPAPADLPPIGDDHGEYSLHHPWVLPGEDGPALHTAWPLVALPLDTWPDSSAVHHEFGEAYQRRVNILRTAALLATTEAPTASRDRPDWENEFPYRLLARPLHSSQFPPVGIFIERTARLVWRRLIELTKGNTSSVATLIDEAQQWVTLGQKGLGSKIAPDRMETFANWVAILSVSSRDDPDQSVTPRDAYSAWSDSAPIRLRREMGRLLTLAGVETIRLAASEPSVADALPSRFFDLLENEFLEIFQHKSLDKARGVSRWNFEPRFHQKLGHAPSSQQAMPSDSKVVCLLQLATDNGAGLSFGDVGEATFWINEDDLIARRFDRAWVKLQGH